jgi:multiple sugar transport system ATP-binding protein
VEPTGDLTYIHLRLGEQLLVASAPGTYRGSADQPIKVEFDQDRLYLFDAATEKSL